jgi:uncharacterized membrane protein
MTDPSPPAADLPSPGNATAPSPGPRWIRIALAVSVALNLAVAGLAIGAWVKDGPGRGMPREMSFGPFTDALSDSDRQEIRKLLGERRQGLRAEREAARAELQSLLATLRAAPFDPAAAQAALSAISSRATDRLDLGRSLIEARILAMSDAERLAFADRLERGLKRR